MKIKFLKLFIAALILASTNILLAAEDDSEELSLDPVIKNNPEDVKNTEAIKSTEVSFEKLPEPKVTDNLAKPIEILQNENAMYGFSAGLAYSIMPLTEKYTAQNDTTKTYKETDQQTNPISNFGFIFRYALVPFNKIGADFNISYLKSLNHSSIVIAGQKLTDVTTVKGEVNLTYAINIAAKYPVYFLAGVGTEQVSGTVVEAELNKNGFGWQYGAGSVISSTFNIEGIYSYYTHRIGTQLVANNWSGTPPYKVDYEGGKVINSGFSFRGTYSFK